ncbi:hypothetical protein CEXT_774131 [Caerostris extrusa]|uniref:Uncharacterized protein n=1 Tax=Caerostris extrusa TaxID=172846 RepID=A0AAV4NIU3_CAEEX|nr:hypothetical protein CEXT_774131 [Caerostris extrusa]
MCATKPNPSGGLSLRFTQNPSWNNFSIDLGPFTYNVLPALSMCVHIRLLLEMQDHKCLRNLQIYTPYFAHNMTVLRKDFSNPSPEASARRKRSRHVLPGHYQPPLFHHALWRMYRPMATTAFLPWMECPKAFRYATTDKPQSRYFPKNLYDNDGFAAFYEEATPGLKPQLEGNVLDMCFLVITNLHFFHDALWRMYRPHGYTAFLPWMECPKAFRYATTQ